MLPLHVIGKPGFKTLMSTVSPNLMLRGRTFYTQLLEKKFNERKLQLKDALPYSTDAATTIDTWTCRRRAPT